MNEQIELVDPAVAVGVWAAIVGNEADGTMIATALRCLSLCNPAAAANGLGRIAREESFGWMLNPTVYLDGKRFDNIREYRDVLEPMAKILALIDHHRPKAVKS